MKRSRRALTFALPALLLLAGCSPAADDPGTPPAIGPGEEAAAAPVRFAGLEAIHAELARQIRLGRPTLLNFWATWCMPCVDELPALGSAAREHEGRGPDFIGISLDAWIVGSESESEARVRATLARQGAGYQNIIYRGDQRPLLEAFDLPGPIPHSILYDSGGRVVTTWNGPVVMRELREEVERLLRSDGGHGAGGGANPDPARQGAA